MATKRYDGLAPITRITFNVPKNLVAYLVENTDNISKTVRDMLYDFLERNKDMWKSGSPSKSVNTTPAIIIDDDLLETLNTLVSKKLFQNRSEVIRTAIFEGISELMKQSEGVGEEDE